MKLHPENTGLERGPMCNDQGGKSSASTASITATPMMMVRFNSGPPEGETPTLLPATLPSAGVAGGSGYFIHRPRNDAK